MRATERARPLLQLPGDRVAGWPEQTISNAETIALIVKAQTARTARTRRKAAQEVVRGNMGLIYSTINRQIYMRPQYRDDLIQLGVIGMMDAIRGFDVSRGFRFSTYATHAIRRQMIRFAQNTQKHIEPLGGDDSTLFENVEDAESAISAAFTENLEALAMALRLLSGRYREVIYMRFGLGGQPRQTLEQIGLAWGVTKERVRQFEARALQILRSSPAWGNAEAN